MHRNLAGLLQFRDNRIPPGRTIVGESSAWPPSVERSAALDSRVLIEKQPIMHLLRGPLAISIVASLALGQGYPLRAAERGEKIREKVERLGPGADVRVYDRQGNPLRGIIDRFDDSAIHLKTGEMDTVFRYNEINSLELAKKTYSAEGEVDPAAARRVAPEIGLGRKVVVKTTAGETFTGNLIRVDAEELAIGTRDTASMAVPYSEMRELKRWRVPLPARIAIGAGVGFAVFACVMLAIFSGD